MVLVFVIARHIEGGDTLAGMANPDHVAKLKEGGEEWNRWREKHLELTVDLSQADLSWASLNDANLSGANLESSLFFETVLSDLDLSDTRGLETCRHLGPSTIDFRTLQRSGPLPLPFLQGCGLPDTLIEYLPSLLNQPILFESCFISYSTKDQTFAERLHADLQNKGVRCWFAPHDFQGGKILHEQIDREIHVLDRLFTDSFQRQHEATGSRRRS